MAGKTELDGIARSAVDHPDAAMRFGRWMGNIETHLEVLANQVETLAKSQTVLAARVDSCTEKAGRAQAHGDKPSKPAPTTFVGLLAEAGFRTWASLAAGILLLGLGAAEILRLAGGLIGTWLATP